MSDNPADQSTKISIDVPGYEQEPHLLLTEQQIAQRVAELGTELASKYKELGSVHVVTVLQGAMHFSSDLQRAMQHAAPNLPMVMETIRLQSYEGAGSTGTVRTLSETNTSLTGQHILLVEDIYDTGNTLTWLCDHFKALEPASLTVVTLLDKQLPSRPADLLGEVPLYIGFEIPNDFVIGYGLDYNQHYRNLRGIYWLEKQG